MHTLCADHGLVERAYYLQGFLRGTQICFPYYRSGNNTTIQEGNQNPSFWQKLGFYSMENLPHKGE